MRSLTGRWRGVLKLGGLVVLIVLANLLAGQAVEALRFELRPSNEDIVHRMAMVAAASYALLIAVPFVPGVEVGLALIGMLGPAIVPLVYASTLAGLLIAFAAGRFVSLAWLAGVIEQAGLDRTARLLATIGTMDAEQRLAFLLSNAPNRTVPFLLRHRYLALAVVINIPGNIVIGGGGGISLMAGASGLYSSLGFAVTIVLAVAPVPLAILIFGPQLFAS